MQDTRGTGGTAGHLISFQSHTVALEMALLKSEDFHDHRQEETQGSVIKEIQHCDPSSSTQQAEILFRIYTKVTHRQDLESETTRLMPMRQDQLSAAEFTHCFDTCNFKQGIPKCPQVVNRGGYGKDIPHIISHRRSQGHSADLMTTPGQALEAIWTLLFHFLDLSGAYMPSDS